MNPTKISRTRKGLVWLAAGASAFGVGLGAASIASAASDSSSSTTVAATNTATDTATDTASNTAAGSSAVTPPAGQHVDPASLPNGPGETVLTGDALAKVTAAAQAADPGATLIRAETDSSGHAYEAHMKNADGSVTTLYFTSSFAADGQDTGFGPGGPGHGGPQGPQGQPPVQPSTSGSTTGA